ncbi:MAG: hypothetical protein ACUVUC_14150 [Thermoguttaceae bacterium]
MATEQQEQEKLRKVAWSELFPWLILARCFRIAIQLRLLFLSAIGVFLMIGGWTLLSLIFWGQEPIARDIQQIGGHPWAGVTQAIPDRPSLLGDLCWAGLPEPGATLLKRAKPTDPLVGSFEHLSRPFRDVFSWRLSQTGKETDSLRSSMVAWVAFGLACGLWAVAVWAFFGGAVSRAAAVELATGDRARFLRSLSFAASKWPSYFAAPLIPLIGVILIVIPMGLVAWALLYSGKGWGVLTILAAIGWPLALLGGFLIALLLLGLVFGWPLFWGNLSTEGVDSFDAVGRTYDYVYHRPLHYLFYAVVAGIIGLLGWIIVSNFFSGIVAGTNWAVSWGSKEEQILMITSTGAELGGWGKVGAWLIRFWIQCIKFLGVGFLYSYLFVAAVGMYLLLRRDVDATEMDEVLPEEEVEQPAPPAPEAKPETAGAPVAGEQPAPTEPPGAEAPPPPAEGQQPPPPEGQQAS